MDFFNRVRKIRTPNTVHNNESTIDEMRDSITSHLINETFVQNRLNPNISPDLKINEQNLEDLEKPRRIYDLKNNIVKKPVSPSSSNGANDSGIDSDKRKVTQTDSNNSVLSSSHLPVEEINKHFSKLALETKKDARKKSAPDLNSYKPDKVNYKSKRKKKINSSNTLNALNQTSNNSKWSENVNLQDNNLSSDQDSCIEDTAEEPRTKDSPKLKCTVTRSPNTKTRRQRNITDDNFADDENVNEDYVKVSCIRPKNINNLPESCRGCVDNNSKPINKILDINNSSEFDSGVSGSPNISDKDLSSGNSQENEKINKDKVHADTSNKRPKKSGNIIVNRRKSLSTHDERQLIPANGTSPNYLRKTNQNDKFVNRHAPYPKPFHGSGSNLKNDPFSFNKFGTAGKNLNSKIQPTSKRVNGVTLRDLYSLRAVLSDSDNGTVFSGRRRIDNAAVAIKRIMKSKVKRWHTIKDKSVPMEIALLRKVNESRHPGVVTLLEWFECSDCFLLVMARPTPVLDLFDFVSEKKRLDENTCKMIFIQVVEAMLHCHTKNVLHRDIKLENILVKTDTLISTLIDFGCGTHLHSNLYKDFAGTPQYYPPEYYICKQYHGLPAAVWSVGVMLYAMLCGRLPFASAHEIVHLEPSWHGSFCRKISPNAKELVENMLKKQPRKRILMADICKDKWLKNTKYDKITGAVTIIPEIVEDPGSLNKINLEPGDSASVPLPNSRRIENNFGNIS